MKAATIKKRPGFPLIKLTDVQNANFMQLPCWLFTDPGCAGLSLDAKLVYTFLLHRLRLSQRSGWANDFGEVFVIYPRRELARALGVCEQRVTAAFQALAERKLIWERRCGLGRANQIYLARTEPAEGPDFFAPEPEPQDGDFQTREACGSGSAEPEIPEPQFLQPSKNEKRNKKPSHNYVSRSVCAGGADGPADGAEPELMEILNACGLACFEPETARVFENAIERLFYSERFRVGGAVLPQSRVRAKLRLLDCVVLQDAERKLHANLEREIKNSTAYTMATIFNSIAECAGDLMVDPDLNAMRSPPLTGRPVPPDTPAAFPPPFSQCGTHRTGKCRT